MFAHNPIVRQHWPDIAMGQWVYIIYNGHPDSISVLYNDRNWKCYGSTSMSVLCFELHGVLMPNEWYADTDVSNLGTYQLLKNSCPGKITSASLETMTGEEWAVVKEYVNGYSNTEVIQRYAYESLVNVLYSICRTGNVSTNVTRKLQEEIKKNKLVTIDIDITAVTEYWAYMGKRYDMDMIKALMTSLRGKFSSADFIRVRNLIDFAKHRGLTQYYAVREAFTSCSDFPWWKVFLRAPEEFHAYERARNYVKDQDYFGYNPDLQIAAAGNYPIMAYVSIQLLKRKLGKDTFVDFKTSINDRINRREWDVIIDQYIQAPTQEPSADEQQNVQRMMRRFERSFRASFQVGEDGVRRLPDEARMEPDDMPPRRDDDDSSDHDDNMPPPPAPPQGTSMRTPSGSQASTTGTSTQPSSSASAMLPPSTSQAHEGTEVTPQEPSEQADQRQARGETKIPPGPSTALRVRSADGSKKTKIGTRSHQKSLKDQHDKDLIKYVPTNLGSLGKKAIWDEPESKDGSTDVYYQNTKEFGSRQCVILSPPRKDTCIVFQAGMNPLRKADYEKHNTAEEAAKALCISYNPNPPMVDARPEFQLTRDTLTHEHPAYPQALETALSLVADKYVIVMGGVLYDSSFTSRR